MEDQLHEPTLSKQAMLVLQEWEGHLADDEFVTQLIDLTGRWSDRG